jgi:hypothetical protein
MKVFIISFLTLVCAACNQTEKINNTPTDKFNQIESIVGTNNWQMIDGPDTSYIYFSRIGNSYINGYRYQINKGDSINTQMNNIIHQQDSVIWNWGKEKLLLVSVNDNTIQWEKMSVDNAKYTMQKTDSLHISFVFPDGHKAILKRTLPLSTFLVRKQYDYAHGTSYLDSAEITTRPVKKQ